MKSIIMNSEEVVATRAGRKTQFRRAVKPQPYWQEMGYSGRGWYWQGLKIPDEAFSENSYGQPGDKLSVKETWRFTRRYHLGDDTREPQFEIEYKDGTFKQFFDESKLEKLIHFVDKSKISCAPNFAWQSPVTMAAWMSRITLEITNVCFARLQDITIEDVLSEGIEEPDWLSNIDSWYDPDDVMIEIYSEYWNKYFKPDWANNPWVWIVDFKVT